MIQKKARMKIQRSRMRDMKETHEKDKYFEYKHKIEQVRLLSKQNFKLIIPEDSDKVRDIIISTAEEEPSKTASQQ